MVFSIVLFLYTAIITLFAWILISMLIIIEICVLLVMIMGLLIGAIELYEFFREGMIESSFISGKFGTGKTIPSYFHNKR